MLKANVFASPRTLLMIELYYSNQHFAFVFRSFISCNNYHLAVANFLVGCSLVADAVADTDAEYCRAKHYLADKTNRESCRFGIGTNAKPTATTVGSFECTSCCRCCCCCCSSCRCRCLCRCHCRCRVACCICMPLTAHMFCILQSFRLLCLRTLV